MEFINKRGYLDAQFDSGTAFILAKVSGPKGKRKIGILKNRLRFERGPPPIYGHRLIVDVRPRPPGDGSDGSDSDIETDSDPDGIDSDSGGVNPGGPGTNSGGRSPHPSGSPSGSDVDEEVNPGGVGPNSDGNESGSEVDEGTADPGLGSGGADPTSDGTGAPPGVEEETNPGGMGSNSDGNESGSEVDEGTANPGPGGAGEAGGTGAPPGGNNSSPGVGGGVNPGGPGSNSGEGSVSPGSGSDTAGTDPSEDNSGPSEGNSSGDESDLGTISAPAPILVPGAVSPIGRRHISNAHGNFSIKNDSTFGGSSGTNNSTRANDYNHFDSNESNRNCGQNISLGTLVWNSPDHGYEGVQPHCRPYHVRGYPPRDLYLDFDGNIIFNKPRPSPPKIDSEGRIPIPDY
ncbi:hypothetical protein TWF225_011140 [Orbilia oligospora]|nr:hypothetical protein TWF225_011140 [Orbilia oligospora]KAF3248530.1 hypothetical protein TWF217_009128 [Orbilia oligospora]KAF3251316.1 hypothetical protein TWF128_007317 [Orbilia oligospora]